jgi:hypothetical protein
MYYSGKQSITYTYIIGFQIFLFCHVSKLGNIVKVEFNAVLNGNWTGIV